MIKSQLSTELTQQHPHIPERDVVTGIQLILDQLTKSLGMGRRIEIRGFGSFSLHHRPPRNAHNPKTGEKVRTEAKYTPHFKPGKDLKDRVNEAREDNPID